MNKARFFHAMKSIIFVISVIIVLTSCRQPLDIDANRTITPTNLPEIIDVTPRVTQLGDRITIVGNNFVNVRNVFWDTIPLDSLTVSSPNRIIARVPSRFDPAQIGRFYNQAYNISVVTRVGTAQSEQFLGMSFGSIAGYISIDNTPLDSVIVVAVHEAKNWVTQTITSNGLQLRSPGFYSMPLSNINTGSGYSTILAGADFKVRPFLHGYSFVPVERTVIVDRFGNKINGETEFTAKRLPITSMPEVHSISPINGSSFSGSPETGTIITLRGKNMNAVKQIMVGVPYPVSFGSSVTTIRYVETINIRRESDEIVQFRIPRLDRTITVSGRTYTNCQIYLLLENGSYLAPQRISVTYI